MHKQPSSGCLPVCLSAKIFLQWFLGAQLKSSSLAQRPSLLMGTPNLLTA